jgi:hypothetical protein
MIRRFSFLCNSFFLALALACCGCNQSDIPEMGFVKGKVTINGKPLTGADLEAAPVKGRPAYGVIQPDGSYVMMYKKNVPGTLLGVNRFSPVWPTSVRGPEFPPEYLNVEIEIKPGENTYNLEMKSELQAWTEFKPKPLATVSTITPVE